MGKRRILVAGMTVVAVATGVGGVVVANGGSERFRTELLGTNEVPVADLDGRGRAVVQFEIGDDELCFSVEFDRAGTPNRGHIHIGAAGVNSDIVVPLFELRDMPADARHDALERGRLKGCVPATPEVLAAIAANPAGYYVNLHNARFPAGALRGQLD